MRASSGLTVFDSMMNFDVGLWLKLLLDVVKCVGYIELMVI